MGDLIIRLLISLCSVYAYGQCSGSGGRGRGLGGRGPGGRVPGGRGPRGRVHGGRVPRGRGPRSGPVGMKGGNKVIVTPHRHEGVFIGKGKDDAILTN